MADRFLPLEPLNASPTGWRVYLFGSFRLVDPAGATVSVSSRKVEGLLAILAMNRTHGIARDVIAEILWPGRPLDLQRANFRQALAQLRRAIGNDSVESSRVHCRLATSLRLQSDHDEDAATGAEVFMPGQEGEWFEELRVRLESGGSATQPRASVVESFQQTLRWFAENDGEGMFQLLRSSPSLARGLRYREILSLLDRAGKVQPGTAGWSAYWRGASEGDLGVCARWLRFAFAEAQKENDSALASEVCLELGKVYGRTGAHAKAWEVSKMADAIANQVGTRVTQSNAHWLRGTLLTHWSDGPGGLESLERSEGLWDNPIDRAISRSARAFYLLSDGRHEQAHDLLDSSIERFMELGHQRIEVVVRMCRAVLSIHGGPRGRAIQHLESAVAAARSLNSLQFRVYGEELLAKVYRLDGNNVAADSIDRSARAGRTESRMVLTPLEAKRVDSVS